MSRRDEPPEPGPGNDPDEALKMLASALLDLAEELTSEEAATLKKESQETESQERLSARSSKYDITSRDTVHPDLASAIAMSNAASQRFEATAGARGNPRC